MRILLLTSTYNTMCRNIRAELGWRGHETHIELALSETCMLQAVADFKPEMIVCPMLTARIPDLIWKKYICLIVHPGIRGDRGCSSLDWAIMNKQDIWGVTVLQADEEYDAGPIWNSQEFAMRSASKSSLYRDEVVRCGVKGVLEAVTNYEDGEFEPQRLDYSDPDVRGCFQPLMKQSVRAIDWRQDSAVEIVRKIRSADSNPGLLDKLFGAEYYLYGAHEEEVLRGQPGDIIATRYGAICRATTDGAVWITHMKKKNRDCQATFKLPSTMVIGHHLRYIPELPFEPLHHRTSKTFSEIWYEEIGKVGYLYFEFYNGAMSTVQCERLLEAYLAACRRNETKVLVLMGGRDFWSNGIHLNVIEAAEDPAEESMRNLQAMNNLVHAIITTHSHITVAGVQGSAGAGGVMLALAADFVIVRSGLLLNPFYKTMGNLYGSEFWTYLLPKRVGVKKTIELTEQCLPVSAAEALEIGLADAIYTHDEHKTFRDKIAEVAEMIVNDESYMDYLEKKYNVRKKEERSKPLLEYQAEELEKTSLNFFGADDAYHKARSNFVRKVPPPVTPEYINRNQGITVKDNSNRLMDETDLTEFLSKWSRRLG